MFKTEIYNNFEFADYFKAPEQEEIFHRPQFELSLAFPENKPDEEFFIYNEKRSFDDYSNSGNMTPTKEESYPTDDMAASSSFNNDLGKADSYLQVDFEGENPNMDDFECKIRDEINFKGVNEIICEALDIKNNDEFSLKSAELIKVKKRKTKDQIRQLEAEFARNDDWTKEFMNTIAERLNLEPSQVYKWHWDQISKKLGKAPKRQAKLQKQNKRKRAAKQSARSRRARN